MTAILARTLPVALFAALAAIPAAAQTPAAPAKPAATPQIGFTVLDEGTGASPGDEDVVLVSYIGKLPNGTVFDQNGQTPFGVSDVVPGFSQGLKRMKRGGAYKLTIPPELGYGAQAAGDIPPNSTLTFTVMLFDFKSRAELMLMQQQQQQGSGEGASAPAAPAPTTPQN